LRWVQRYVPEFEKRWSRYARPVGNSWRVDETYLKIKGQWVYHPVVQHWLKAHKRFHMHFTPTSSSWMNLVERFFGELSSEVVREGSFQSLRELVRAIESYLAERNQKPKKYVWRATGLKILEKIQRAKAALAAADIIFT
jgi:hypothetical protein